MASNPSIDAVTASFAASLALAAGGSAPDLGKIGGGPVRRSSQSFLLGRPLTRRLVDPSGFINHFHRTWIVNHPFRIQERAENLFLVSFQTASDRNKVLKGGVWCFERAPVCWEPYDGILPLAEVPMRHVRIWTRVLGIPPAFEEPDNLKLVGNLLGGFVDYDKKEFLRGKMRIIFTHDISKPILLERSVFLSKGVEPLLKFEYEHLQGRCSVCWLVTHSGISCEERPAPNPVARSLNFPHSALPPGYAFAAKPPGSLVEAAPAQPKKKEKKKPVIRRLESAEATNLPPVCTEIGFPGPILQDSSLINDDGGELGMTDVLGLAPSKAATAISSRKRERQGHYTPSPKKLKTILGGKVPVLHAESLGLSESDLDSTLVSLKQKKKVGRPLGSLNKVPKPAKDLITPPLHISTPKFGRGEASPYNKGKEVA